MIKHLSNTLAGWQTLTIPSDQRVRAFDLLYRNSIPFTDEKETADGSVTIRLRGENIKLFRHFAEKENILYTLSGTRGLPTWIAFLRYRPALVLGALLFAGWMFYSTRIIWDVRIDGAEKTNPSEIIALLDELGCGIYESGILSVTSRHPSLSSKSFS